MAGIDRCPAAGCWQVPPPRPRPAPSPSRWTPPPPSPPRRPARAAVCASRSTTAARTDLLSPYNLPNWASAARAEAAYERLFKVDPLGVPRPRLALSLEPNKTGTVWRCKLRQGVTFHSGKKFTAEDVLYSYRYIANPKNKAEGQPRVSQIDLANSKAISPFEIEFRLKAPIGDFASTVSDKAIWIAPTGKTDFGTRSRTAPARSSSCSGSPAVNSLYKRFEHYWGLANGGGPYVDELEFQTIVDDSAQPQRTARRAGRRDGRSSPSCRPRTRRAARRSR